MRAIVTAIGCYLFFRCGGAAAMAEDSDADSRTGGAGLEDTATGVRAGAVLRAEWRGG